MAHSTSDKAKAQYLQYWTQAFPSQAAPLAKFASRKKGIFIYGSPAGTRVALGELLSGIADPGNLASKFIINIAAD
jgi:hypothetical protein